MRNCARNAAGAHPRGLGRLFRSAALVEAARFSNRLGFNRLAEAGKSFQPVRAFPENIDTLVSAEFGAAQGASPGAHRDA